MYEKRDLKRQKKPRKKSKKEEEIYDFLPPELQFTGKQISNQKP